MPNTDNSTHSRTNFSSPQYNTWNRGNNSYFQQQPYSPSYSSRYQGFNQQLTPSFNQLFNSLASSLYSRNSFSGNTNTYQSGNDYFTQQSGSRRSSGRTSQQYRYPQQYSFNQYQPIPQPQPQAQQPQTPQSALERRINERLNVGVGSDIDVDSAVFRAPPGGHSGFDRPTNVGIGSDVDIEEVVFVVPNGNFSAYNGLFSGNVGVGSDVNIKSTILATPDGRVIDSRSDLKLSLAALAGFGFAGDFNVASDVTIGTAIFLPPTGNYDGFVQGWLGNRRD